MPKFVYIREIYYWFEVLNLRGSGKDFIKLLKEKFPKSYGVMVNRENFWEYVKELKGVIKKENIKTSEVVIHYPEFKIMKL